MKRVLIPTDFSENAWTSLIYAIKMFQETDCTFYLLHTAITSSTSTSIFSNKKLIIEKEKSTVALEKLKTEAQKIDLNPNHSFETILSFYPLNKAINYTNDKYLIDFIIIGTKGATNTKNYVFGSNTTRVLKNIKKCATIVVPKEFYFKNVENIVILSDLKHKMNKDLLLPLKQIADQHNTKISLLHIINNEEISEAQKEEINSINNMLSSYEINYQSRLKYASNTQIVNDFIEEINADMLFLTYYKNNIFEKLINSQSLTTALSQNPNIPMLIVPNH